MTPQSARRTNKNVTVMSFAAKIVAKYMTPVQEFGKYQSYSEAVQVLPSRKMMPIRTEAVLSTILRYILTALTSVAKKTQLSRRQSLSQ